ncbi:hypothetical protein Cgig2_003693 [Carnegiea gigantea]|uniref:Uncharacterized protein n=1 Tax=Carnegiea gigantea TaxID=171969 RepID=A0A9Q1QI40_9CARY|nr:hypothetical protein Cgig2_003693 [Carnegiea gigantea]
MEEKGGNSLVAKSALGLLKIWRRQHPMVPLKSKHEESQEHNHGSFGCPRWLPRPKSFKPITPQRAPYEHYTVSNFIDFEGNFWKESLVWLIFIPCDVETILNLPLCASWPSDKLTWYYNLQGLFTVRSAYHMLMSDTLDSPGSSSPSGSDLTDTLWSPKFRFLLDYIENANEKLDQDSFGDFLGVMWECWNARNRIPMGSTVLWWKRQELVSTLWKVHTRRAARISSLKGTACL